MHKSLYQPELISYITVLYNKHILTERRGLIEQHYNLKANDERKDIILTTESKKDLNEVINNEINTLIELQKKLNENIIDFNEVKDTVFKTEYFLFKLKSIL